MVNPPERDPLVRVALLVALSLSLGLTACGGGAQGGQDGSTTPAAGGGSEGEGESAQAVPEEAVSIPPLPDAPSEAAAAPRTAPTITTVALGEQALAEGFYTELGAALEAGAATGSPAAQALLRARYQLATGAYDEAATSARAAQRDTTLAGAAKRVEAEARIRRGRLDDADAILRTLPETDTRAQLLQGHTQSRRGRTVEARAFYMRAVQPVRRQADRNAAGPEALYLAAVGAAEMGYVRDANELFMAAARSAEGALAVEVQLTWARLFLDKYDTGHAEEGVRAALAINPNHPEARALYARIKIEQRYDFSGAEEQLDQALAVNPNLVMALVTRAGIVLRDLDIEEADRRLDAALAIDPHDLEALSVRAAVRFLADDTRGFEQAKREVLRRHPTYSRMYATIAPFAEWEHRYPDIVAMSREAMTLNPRDALAQATLGLNLLRMGDEEEGLQVLQGAWGRDRYNVRVFNTLNLYDEIIGREYQTFESEPFIFRMHQTERPLLERYVPRTIGAAYADMRTRYGFTPEGPLRFELYADMQHFSLRTTGLPNLGVQGVCFGKVVTAISPRGGPFNWGQIGTHELAHVFHIQLSRNHVPRWFTEGLAEYETIMARPEWRREMDHQLHAALRSGSLPPLRLMNRAFTHARSAQEMMVAYYASSQIVKFIAERYGFPRVVRMLREWGRGARTPDVVQRALGVDIDALDEQFREHTRQRLASLDGQFAVDPASFEDLEGIERDAAAAPTNAGKQGRLAVALMFHGQVERAGQVADQALAIDANEPNALFVKGRVSMATGEAAAGAAFFDRMIAAGHDGYGLRLLLARAALAREDVDAAKGHLEAAARLQPSRPEAWSGLNEIAARTNDRALRVRALERLAQIDEHGRDPLNGALRLAVEDQRWDDVVTFGERGLMNDPHNPTVHLALGRGYEARRDHQRALYEYDSALLCEPPAPADAHLGRARALMGLGRRADARAAADSAIAADPNSRAAAEAILAP